MQDGSGPGRLTGMPRRRVGAFLLALAMAVPFGTPARAGVAGEVRKNAFRLLNEGVAAYNRADYKAAIEALSKAAGMSLNSFRANYFLGLAYAGERRFAEAVASYTVALDLDPSHLQANVAMGDAWLGRGDVDEANPYYARALKLRAELPAALDGLARVAEAQAEDDKAIALYERALASDKGYAPAYMHLGDLYLRRGKLDDAVRLLVEAVSIRPDFGPGLNRLASAYGRLGFHNEAVATIRKAIELEPTHAEHHATLGEILLGMGISGGARDSFMAAVAIEPALPQARLGLAELARRSGDYRAALEQLDLALADSRLDRRTRDVLTKRRAALVIEQSEETALTERIAGGSASAADRVALAGLQADRGRWNEAADLLATTSPEGAERERLAFYTFRAGRFRDAHEIYAELAHAQARADLEANSGAALARLGDDARALAAFERALALDAGNGRAALYRANALLRLGRASEATAAYRKFLAAHPEGETAEQARRILAQLDPGERP